MTVIHDTQVFNLLISMRDLPGNATIIGIPQTSSWYLDKETQNTGSQTTETR